MHMNEPLSATSEEEHHFKLLLQYGFTTVCSLANKYGKVMMCVLQW